MSCVDAGTSLDHPAARTQSGRATSSSTRCGFFPKQSPHPHNLQSDPKCLSHCRTPETPPELERCQVIAPGLVDSTTARVEDPKLIAESLLRYVRAWAFGFMGVVFGVSNSGLLRRWHAR